MANPNKDTFKAGVYGERGQTRQKAATGGGGPHTHPESDIVNLITDLAGKAASVHTHAESDVTSLVSDLAGKAATAHAHGVAEGGTGLTSVTSGNFLTGNGTGALNSRTPAQARADVGADNATNLTSGTVADARISGAYTNMTSLTLNGTVTNNGGSYDARRTVGTQTAFDTRIGGTDANSRYNVAANGVLNFGNGTAVSDTTLARSGVNLLEITSRLNVTDKLLIGSVDQGRGPVGYAAITASSTAASAATAAITTASLNFPTGRAFRIAVRGRYQGTIANDRLSLTLFKGSTAGTAWGTFQNYTITVISIPYMFYMDVIVVNNTGSTISTAVVLATTRTTGTGNVQVIASAADPAYLLVEDIGASADFASSFAIT